MAASDIVTEPVKGTGKGIWRGLKYTALGSAIAGASVLGVATLVFAGLTSLVFGTAFIVPTLTMALVGAVVGGVTGTWSFGVVGASIGGALGLIGGIGRGIIGLVTGRSAEADLNEQKLHTMRQQAAEMDLLRAESLLRQQQRAEAMGINPDVKNGNVARLEAERSQAQSTAQTRI